MTAQGFNPRFIVTNLPARGFKGEEDKTRFAPVRLYEELYCARGEMENMLKQQTLDLRADRMSTHYLASNQLRLWLATLAYCCWSGCAAGAGGHGTGPCHRGQRAAQAFESGRPGAGQRAPGLCAVKQRLSAPEVVPALSSAVDGLDARNGLREPTGTRAWRTEYGPPKDSRASTPKNTTSEFNLDASSPRDGPPRRKSARPRKRSRNFLHKNPIFQSAMKYPG